MSEVINTGCVTTLDLDPDTMLQNTIGQLKSVIVIGETHEGTEWFASSVASGPAVLWELERAKLKLISLIYEE